MRTAQTLYEGVKINGVSQGLISYMRTDSVHLSNDALAELRQQIGNDYGADYLPGKPNHYKTKAKNAQEAHEAIRPTNAALTPEQARSSLSEDQYRLYDLVWRRAMASQMMPALVDTVAV
jgi:DNA topoisomerase-1